MAEDDKLTKITITSGTAFDGMLVAEGETHEVTDKNRGQAQYLISIGKAVAGDVPAPDVPAPVSDKNSNKAVGLTTGSADALVKK